MAAKRKAQAPEERWLVLDFGAFRIESEDGKYYHCGDRRFQRSNPHIQKIETRSGRHTKGAEAAKDEAP